MKINLVVVTIVIVAIIAFFYFVIKRNRKDQKELENELNEKQIKPQKHDKESI